MDQEKKMTQIVSPVGEYLAPIVKLVEIKARQVICGSFDGTLPKMDWSEENAEGWE